MELPESQQAQDSHDARVQLIDTSDPDDEGDFGFCGDMDLASELGLSPGVDFGGDCVLIIGFIFLDSLE